MIFFPVLRRNSRKRWLSNYCGAGGLVPPAPPPPPPPPQKKKKNKKKTDILQRIAQVTAAALTKLKPIWRDNNISLGSKVKLKRSLVISIFLYACESWTTELEKRPQAFEHLVQGPSYQPGGSQKDPSSHWRI